ncbi:acyl carrier protein (ACP) [Mycoplasmopsis canis UFG4]|uniref:Acyl carrier protein (ACP) n=2 Tax=Mycoplasmopsis canis TaxID=29555 RepID=I1A4R1_9BACT|nr:phosphopantetheine-binding protein [Mycoplasmopsis canis]AKF41321.1 acyl carrier protein [Mycoplasmopsis canis]AMD81437.1 acyl carrier protein [Mycoplasmopsis canis PG 14]EIE39391.1 acyl carrier protein (ACP) [Mycoplasmopsis canis UF33]EIE39542.1 acyl carrier protein (ACP) [Mycoplasmopsis canis PG 14]EIE39696.1 acyl carrier protein (ACP) [Mycoplasmopsis canis UF31]
MENVKAKIIENFTRLARKKVVETDVVKDLKIDSLDLAEIIVLAEEEFNISISDQELMQIVTVQDVVDLVLSKV